jgi:hypothetical protein
MRVRLSGMPVPAVLVQPSSLSFFAPLYRAAYVVVVVGLAANFNDT